jgi:integrase/recombinase XerD
MKDSLICTQNDDTILALVEGCCEYMYAERHLRPKTISGYREAMSFFAKLMGNPRVSDLTVTDFISFKAKMARRGAGESRIGSIVNAVKCLLTYSQDILHIPVLERSSIRAPKPKRRQVLYLTPVEWQTFVDGIALRNWDRTPRESGYRFRAMVETLIATGMRISEVLALDRNSINFEAKQAAIIGKGNKQRTVFFTDRALDWVQQYLTLRKDTNPALFVSGKGTRLAPDTVGAMFRRMRCRTDLEKKVTPHVLRHTTATNLLRNGCPIGFIKEILGHSDLMTTCRYYLGVLNEVETKRAHEIYSNVAGDASDRNRQTPPIAFDRLPPSFPSIPSDRRV